MITTPTSSDARVSTSVTILPSEPQLSASKVLRMFDASRRGLALILTGREGICAGYDGLTIDRAMLDQVADGHVLTVTALLGARQGGRHLVDYVATVTDQRGHCVVLAQAHGWTLVPSDPTDPPGAPPRWSGSTRRHPAFSPPRPAPPRMAGES